MNNPTWIVDDFCLVDDGTLDTVIRGPFGWIGRYDQECAADYRRGDGTLDVLSFVPDVAMPDFEAADFHVETTNGHKLRSWDDGFGPFWIYEDSSHLVGVVRAQTWEDAFGCCEDEILDDADPEDPENQPDEDGNLPGHVGIRGNGEPSAENLHSWLYDNSADCQRLTRLTEEYARQRGIVLVFTP